MQHQKLFQSMSPEGKRFYSRVFNNCLLNLHAVRLGLFDTLLCETNDLRVIARWKAALPNVVESLRAIAQRDRNNPEI